MITYMRFRLQRVLRQNYRRIRRTWKLSVRYLQFNVFSKWRQLTMIRRMVLVWWGIIGLCLAGVLLQIRAISHEGITLRPLDGGSYTEGLVGSVTTLNPVLPEGSASSDVSHIIFSGLTKVDTSGSVTPDLATRWDVSPDGKMYTFHLRHGVTWQDGVPFTAQDVAFTLTAIQNPDTRSPLSSNWQGVKVGVIDDATVTFTLPKPYTPFINATTVGIIPQHLLVNTEPSALRVAAFNQHPVGTGPYMVDQFDAATGEVSLKLNPHYYGSKPHIQGITFRWYETAQKALEAYSHRQVQGVARVEPSQMNRAIGMGRLKLYTASTPDEVAVFLRTTSPLLQDKAVRQALAQATDQRAIIQNQLYGGATPLAGPIVGSGLNLSGAAHQPHTNPQQAAAALTAAGWIANRDGLRFKDNQPLKLQLVTQSGGVYEGVARQLQQQWKRVGVELVITTVDASTLQQSYIRTRHYDALLYGINIGGDPDEYAFWDSSQVKDPGLNLSQYSSKAADIALESGRTVTDPTLRAVKYKAFLQAWSSDMPAIMLYTPTYTYGVDTDVHGIHIRRLVTPADRFAEIETWSVKVKAVHAR